MDRFHPEKYIGIALRILMIFEVGPFLYIFIHYATFHIFKKCEPIFEYFP
jgi:hypothetical protein